ncbi:hypothetical protein C8R45DRAFT_921480 [Mycena sanguinolenta]|nr:hypothetical protein C8R45DRAFT_921480 [Mycena sanguinolenta]
MPSAHTNYGERVESQHRFCIATLPPLGAGEAGTLTVPSLVLIAVMRHGQCRSAACPRGPGYWSCCHIEPAHALFPPTAAKQVGKRGEEGGGCVTDRAGADMHMVSALDKRALSSTNAHTASTSYAPALHRVRTRPSAFGSLVANKGLSLTKSRACPFQRGSYACTYGFFHEAKNTANPVRGKSDDSSTYSLANASSARKVWVVKPGRRESRRDQKEDARLRPKQSAELKVARNKSSPEETTRWDGSQGSNTRNGAPLSQLAHRQRTDPLASKRLASGSDHGFANLTGDRDREHERGNSKPQTSERVRDAQPHDPVDTKDKKDKKTSRQAAHAERTTLPPHPHRTTRHASARMASAEQRRASAEQRRAKRRCNKWRLMWNA